MSPAWCLTSPARRLCSTASPIARTSINFSDVDLGAELIGGKWRDRQHARRCAFVATAVRRDDYAMAEPQHPASGTAVYRFVGFGEPARQGRHVPDHRHRSGDGHCDNGLSGRREFRLQPTREAIAPGRTSRRASSITRPATIRSRSRPAMRRSPGTRSRRHGQTSSRRNRILRFSIVRRASISLATTRGRKVAPMLLCSPRLRAASMVISIPARERTGHISSTAAAASNVGYQWGGIGYSQMVSWLFSHEIPQPDPRGNPAVPFLSTGQWRIEGPSGFTNTTVQLQESGLYDQWAQDVVTKSLLTGHITAAASASTGTLTLDAATTFPMWEGEIIDCVTVSGSCNVGPLSGVYITSIASGAWGASGSVYNIALAPVTAGVSTSSSQALQNPVFYSGSGPAYYAGTLNDVTVQSQGLAGTVSRNPHTAEGFAGGRRATSRWAAMIYCHNGGACDDPKLSRANDTAAGTPSPAFDYSTTYQASHAATWTGNTVTISGGLTAHARPFVVGQAFSCASCATGLVITSLSVPPTQSTATGAGEVGQTFTFTAKNAAGASIGGSGTGTVTGRLHVGKRRVELHQCRHRAHRQRGDRDRHLRREQPQRQCAELRRAERQVPRQRNRRDRADLPRRHAAIDVRECRRSAADRLRL